MEISVGESKQGRLRLMQRGVIAAAKALDAKARALWGEAFLKADAKTARDPYTRDSAYRVAMVTLTYRPDAQWSPLHISALLKHYREWFRKRGHSFLFVWTVELQGRGIPHYHVVCWFPKGKGLLPPLPDQQGWWPHGMSNAKWVHSPIGYIAKYASKSESKSGMHLPKGCRLWGYGGLPMAERASIAYAVAPRWVKALTGIDTHPVKRLIPITEPCSKTKGGFRHFKVSAYLALATGFAFFSPYEYGGMRYIGDMPSGVLLEHRGFVEVLSPDGEWFVIPTKRV